MPEQALSGVKVLDLTWYIAGPMCTKYLADFGADVLKVEKPGEGDPARRMGPFPNDEPHPEKSGFFLYLNHNKRGITLNLKCATGKKIFKRLVGEADILVESFSPGVMERLGFSYQELEKINPRLIMTSISNFGQTGPYRDFKMTELVLNAMGADMAQHGLPDREPLKRGAYCLQHQAGLIAAVATLAALFTRQRQGFGQYLDISMMETQAGTIDWRSMTVLTYLYTGERYLREDPRVGGISILPGGGYPCKDGFIWCLMTVQWLGRLADLLGMPDLPQRFPNVFDMTRKGELDAIFMEWLAERGKYQASYEGQAKRVPITPVCTSEDLLNDPHYNERGLWVEVDHPVAGKWKYVGPVARMSETPYQLRRRAPMLGEHNVEVYCDQLGYTREDLVRLREAGVI